MTSSIDNIIIDKRYRLIKLLGRGGYGEVYQAFDELLHREVALKLVALRSAAEPGEFQADMDKLQREARATSDISHPNVVSTYAIGVHQASSVYLVMEFVDGYPLSLHLREHGAMPVMAALPIFCQIASAMDVLHTNGVMHRDLTPRNVLLCQSPSGLVPKVLDFGMAKLDRKQAQHISRSGKAFGTLGYMSPEQCLSLPFDQRSDVYAFGLLMYETLSGKPAHPKEGPRSLVAAVKEYPLPLSEVAPERGIPSCLQNIVFRAISKDPKDRYGSFQELGIDLERVRSALLDGAELPEIESPALGEFPMPERRSNDLLPGRITYSAAEKIVWALTIACLVYLLWYLLCRGPQ